MEPTLKDQHSQHGHQDNPNAFRSMRDRMHPPYKAKIWLNSLRPRSIRTWTDLQAEFLKKFFPTHRTNGLKRQISNLSAKENEKFYECWERYMEPSMLVLTMVLIHGYWRFHDKNPDEAMDFLSYVAEVSRGWDEPNKGEVGKMKSQPMPLMLRLGCTP
ncbi:hypothetical protein CK203_089750 [Vitis vinifera]|uniref:Retrotransposon gag domain-containing protein n=1 Tax=Vitis vinifera TaxID=29760 RepID=A0A438BLC6_VITVI|nr:hypothetical protein CK203_089750 [Vitis vinifera]